MLFGEHEKNIGATDRIIRLIFGIVLLAYAWWQSSWIPLVLALFTLYEAFASWCVVYQLIGKNTCPLHQKNKTNNFKR